MNHRKKLTCILLVIPIIFFMNCENPQKAETESNASEYLVNRTENFTVNGTGDNPHWEKAAWIELNKRERDEDVSLKTTVKMLYSETGLYFLFHCEDNRLTATMDEDFLDLWNEDVVEVFLWPDENYPVYFEYELSPLNYELPIMIANMNGDLSRWQPFHYRTDRHTAHATSVIGSEKQSFAEIDAWIAEFFIPYKLLIPLNNVPPKKGVQWRANFYRVDYDQERSVSWLWQLTKGNFHDYKSFGTITFN